MRRGVTWPNGVSTIGTPKSMAGIRDVHIPPHLIATVSAHLERHIDTSPDGLLFRAVRGGNMHPRTFGKLYDNAAHHNPGCRRGLNPPVSSSDLAM